MKELLDTELNKGLNIKLSVPIKKETSQRKVGLLQSQSSLFDVIISSLLELETKSNSEGDQKSQRNNPIKSCNLHASKSQILSMIDLNEEPCVIECCTIAVGSNNHTNYNTCITKFSNLNIGQSHDLRKQSEVRPDDARTLITISRNGDERQRRKKRKKSMDDEIFFLGYCKTNSNLINKQEEHVDVKKGIIKTMNMETLQKCHIEQKNISNKTSDPCKYQSILKRILEVTNKRRFNDNVIGPIPIQAEGINELTKRIEQLVRDSSDVVVKRKLKLCNADENSDNCFELDVNIRKISFQEETLCVKPKKSRSIFSPFYCFSARSDSNDHLEKYTKNTNRKRKSDSSKQSFSSVPKNKISWRMNVPFFEKFRWNPKYCCCCMKVLKCGPVPCPYNCHEDARTKQFRSTERSEDILTNPSLPSSLQWTMKKFSPIDKLNTMGYVNLSPRSNRRYFGGIKECRDLSKYTSDVYYSMSLHSETECADMTETTFNSHRTLHVKTLSPLVCRELFLSRTDCDKEFSGSDKRQCEDTSGCVWENENQTPGGIDRRTYSRQMILSNLTSSFLNFFVMYLESQFQKVFGEKKIDFVNPYELEKRIDKHFLLGKNLIRKRSFMMKKTIFTKYFLSTLCVAKIASLVDVSIDSPHNFSTINILIHTNEYVSKDCCEQLKLEANKIQDSDKKVKKQLKPVVMK